MKILHRRPTRSFVAILVGCRCGRKFLHRLDRPFVACLCCGRTDEVPAMVERLRRAASRTRYPKAARRAQASTAA